MFRNDDDNDRDDERGRNDGKPPQILTDKDWARLQSPLGLSARELEVARRLFDGQGESRIAFLLGISRHTVHTHVKHIYAKLDVHDQRELLLRVFAEYLKDASPQ